ARRPLVASGAATGRWRRPALSIVRNRDVQNFETVMAFLDATHRLLPGLVPAIKHMKIQFGLKTMVGRQEGWF
uniref:TERF1-interacting nuclear factor 2 N-terminal domain-containing protein n=1 Tax=Xiphophorus couchianus TaxID=32473 RepID=A0A3B5L590_9TELE